MLNEDLRSRHISSQLTNPYPGCNWVERKHQKEPNDRYQKKQRNQIALREKAKSKTIEYGFDAEGYK